MKFHYWNRVLHRDIGYFFAGMTIIYALSGIALNHLKDWNPSYIIHNETVSFTELREKENVTREDVTQALKRLDMEEKYKSHYFPKPSVLKIFVDGGSIQIDISSGEGQLELVSRRPLFYEVNLLHYNPGKWWIYFSDLFCGCLILLAITGLFIVKGKNGIKWRGAILVILGLLAPVIYLLFFT